MSGAVIEFVQVSHTILGNRVLSDLNLEVHRGETFVLLGRSGCGKTTTLKLVNRLLDPSSGRVNVEGRSTRDWDPIRLRRGIGYVIQEVGLFPHRTVAQNIALVPSLEKWDEARTRNRVEELLALLGLEPKHYVDRFPWQLSGGQRQRVGVARALAADPPILLMDEPFGALDPLTRSEIQQEFQSLQQRLGKTILFVTHDLAEALRLGTRIGLMKDGALKVSGTASKLLVSDDPEIKLFLEPLSALVELGETLSSRGN